MNGNQEHGIVYVLLCRTVALDEQALLALFRDFQPEEFFERSMEFYSLEIPMMPPASQEQAQEWTKKYWPTVYKRQNPYGPQHNIITDATEDIMAMVETYMDVAITVGQSAMAQGMGKSIGAVIVDRSAKKDGEVIAAAGDARWHGTQAGSDLQPGQPMAHAVMRAIGMVARKRRSKGSDMHSKQISFESKQSAIDFPVTKLEHEYCALTDLGQGGYLCLDFEIYITHEPCIMCSMALLHSRFGRVVFGTQMPSTGGLTVDVAKGTGYGLSWLPSLNWKMLAWQYATSSDSDVPEQCDDWHA